MGNRRLTRLVIAITLLPLLAGCSLLDSGRVLDILGQDNAVRQQLSRIADEVKELPGVETVSNTYDYAARADHVYGTPDKFQLELLVDAKDGADLTAVAESVRSGYLDEQLAPFTKRLIVATGESQLLVQTNFAMSASDLTLDVEYGALVSNAIGEHVTVTLGDPNSGLGEEYSRVIMSHDAELTTALIDNYADVVALHDGSTSSHAWDLPGLWVFGALPARPYLELLGELGDIVPLRANGDEREHPVDGVSLGSGDLSGQTQDSRFLLTLSSHRMPVVAAIASAIAKSGVTPVTLEYPHGDLYGVVQFNGDCVDGVEQGLYDAEFVDELAAAGVPVTVADNLGLCAGSKP